MRLIFLLILLPVFGFGQRPDQFPLEPNPNNSNFESYSQKGGVVKRATLYDLKRYYTPDVVTAPVSYTPAASGNLQNRMEFVKDPAGEVWYIDSQGEAFKLSSGGWIWRVVNATIGSQTFTVVGSVPTNLNDIRVLRNGLEYKVGPSGAFATAGIGVTYNTSTGQFTLTRAIASGEQIHVITK